MRRDVTGGPLSFKEMCARFEVTPRTLRYYEYMELLQPEREGRSRWYHPRDVARMTLILRGRRFGFSLEQIRQWLELYDAEGVRPQLDAWVALADRRLSELRQQQADLAQTIDALQRLRDETDDRLSRGEDIDLSSEKSIKQTSCGQSKRFEY